MPIYAYKCASCGYSKEVLQKLSDPVLTICPTCGLDQYQKQITAAGFQLKGSGWYVTDFRNGGDNKSPASPPASGTANATHSEGTVSPSTPAESSAGKDTSTSPTPTAPAPAASDKPSS